MQHVNVYDIDILLYSTKITHVHVHTYISTYVHVHTHTNTHTHTHTHTEEKNTHSPIVPHSASSVENQHISIPVYFNCTDLTQTNRKYRTSSRTFKTIQYPVSGHFQCGWGLTRHSMIHSRCRVGRGGWWCRWGCGWG